MTASTIDIARAELERRRRQRLAAFPRFGDWCTQVSPAWRWDWPHLVLMQEALDSVTRGEIHKLMFFMPPRHGKSESGTVRYPVYRLERDPATRCLITAYGKSLSEKLSRKARKLGKERFQLSKERTAAEDWETTAGGGIRAVGVCGPVTGTGADLITIDDPVKSRAQANSPAYREAAWEWYCDDIRTRLEPGGAMVLTMTRWHEDDLAGRILLSDDGPNWTVIRCPALAETQEERDEWAEKFGRPLGMPDPLGREPGQALCPERYDEEALAELRRVLRNSFYALFQQTPRAKEGGFFQRAWFEIVPEMPAQVVSRIRWWDRAATEGDGDYTAGVRVSRGSNGLLYVEHVKRGQWASAKRDKAIRETAETDPEGTKFWTEQEPGSSGKDAALAFVRLLEGFTAKFETSTGSKEDRADPLASQAAVGNVKLVRGRWNKAFVDELCEFPTGNNDDQVDAAAGAFNKLMKGRKWEAS